MKHAGKRLLAVLLAVVMVLGSVGVVSAEDTSGSGTADDVTITTGFTANTGNITLSGDFKLTYTFTNVSTGSSSWENFIVEMFNENYVYVDVRADNYGWLANTTSAADTFSVGTGLDSWTDWLAATQSGMDFTVTVVRTGGFVQVITSSD
ncbi:MAG: hypothetical protein LUE29_11595, partial [Lachnospiraceae bacterium]|nr:hypothetical protein [Lachnospiraceae bacterium]